jgi:hypothetical protein
MKDNGFDEILVSLFSSKVINRLHRHGSRQFAHTTLRVQNVKGNSSKWKQVMWGLKSTNNGTHTINIAVTNYGDENVGGDDVLWRTFNFNHFQETAFYDFNFFLGLDIESVPAIQRFLTTHPCYFWNRYRKPTTGNCSAGSQRVWWA